MSHLDLVWLLRLTILVPSGPNCRLAGNGRIIRYRGFGLSEIIAWYHDFKFKIPVNNACLHDALIAFHENCRRSLTFAAITPRCMAYMKRNLYWSYRAKLNILGRIDSREEDESRRNEVEAEYKRIAPSDALPEEVLADEKRCALQLDEHASGFDIMRRELNAVLGAGVVGAWTAFEVAATDIWITAVNARPMSLGVSAMQAQTVRGSMKAESPSDAPQSKSKHVQGIDFFALLQEYEFDLKDRIGSMLWSKRKFDFNSFSGIQDAYFSTFAVRRKEGKTVTSPEIKDKWFPKATRQTLYNLECTRHALVHRGGRADGPFLKRIRHPKLSALTEGSTIEIDGTIVMAYMIAVVESVEALFIGVDNWLSDNPK
jgi:hypothetical protein